MGSRRVDKKKKISSLIIPRTPTIIKLLDRKARNEYVCFIK